MTTGSGPSSINNPSQRAQEHIPELAGLRGLAALMVVFLHYIVHHLYTYPGSIFAYAQKYLMFLWAGVDVFFVLSGFLLGGILLDQRNKPNCLKVFYLRRALRIIPSYIVLLACYAAALEWWRVNPRPGMSWLLMDQLPLWSYVLYVQNFFMAAQNQVGALFIAATWSLAVEEQFYLLLPLLLLRWCPIRTLPYCLSGLIVAAPIFRWAFFLVGPTSDKAITFLLPMRWDSLLFGVLAAWLVRNPSALINLTKHLDWVRICLWIALTIAATIPLQGSMSNPWPVIFDYSWLAITVAVLLVYLKLQPESWISCFLSLKPLCYFGRISYTVYLFHTAILGLSFSLLLGKEPILAAGSDWLVMAAAFGFTVLFAEFSWRTFEAPLIKLGHGFSYASGTRQVRLASINQ